MTTTTTSPRFLPGMSDDAGWTPETVAQIAGVSLPAHALAHPRPVHTCPWCPPVAGDAPDASTETHWRMVADRRPTWTAVSA